VTFGLTDTYDWVDQDPWAAGGLNFPITTPSTTGISTYYKYILRTTVQPTGSLAVFTEQTGCFGFTT
ncbi:MAG TPA: hypothetical protein VG389_01685, partial [Myxococcota bacterium]|nr:hypothetical protein [Myxococcota bacterium]